MSIARQGYNTTYIATASEKVETNANGYIAQDGETAVGYKRISVKGVNVDNDLSKNTEVIDAFVNYFAGGSHDSLSSRVSASWETGNSNAED